MSKFGKLTALIGSVIVATVATYAAPAAAQATRTWVSGVGDDANPCSRTAPCKTFAGAISKTAAGGEINCLDNGAYGALTIVKSISIDCRSVLAGVLSSSTNGITINAGVNDVVFLRGLDINGAPPGSPGLNGVRLLAGAAVHVEDSVIRNFIGAAPNGNGIVVATSAGSPELYVVRTVVNSNGNGISVVPTASSSPRIFVRDSEVDNNTNIGLRIDTTGLAGSGVRFSVEDTSFLGGGQGVSLTSTPGNAVVIGTIVGGVIAGNTTGIVGNGTGVNVRLGDNTITGNGTGISALGSSNVQTYGDNRVNGNTADGAFSGTLQPKK